MTIKNISIPDRPPPGSPRTVAPSAVLQGLGDKHATGATNGKIRGRNNIVTGTWNVRSLSETGKIAQLTHEMERYTWNILGLCETRWTNFGEHTTPEGHKLYYSGDEKLRIHGVGFLVHKDTVSTVMGCRPISSRLITIRLRSTPFNVFIIQAYAPTSDHSEEDLEDFYQQLQAVIEDIPKKDILIVQGDWNAKVGMDSYKVWKPTCGPYGNERTNDRGLRLLEFAKGNDLVIANTLGQHKAPRRWTWHHPNGEHHNQIDYIMIQKRFKSGISAGKTRTFPGADIGSDHDLVMMTFRLRLKKAKSAGQTRIKFDLEKLKDPQVADSFKAMIGGKFAPLTILSGEDEADLDKMTEAFNTNVVETAKTILGKPRHAKKPWVTEDLLTLCDKRRELKKLKGTEEGAKEYREANMAVKKGMTEAKENWIAEQCSDIESSLKNNNSKKAYQIVKKLTNTTQGRTTTIQDKTGKCLMEEQDILNRWTEYCSELYNYPTTGNPEVLNVPPSTDTEAHPILPAEIEVAMKALKKGKSAGVDNIPGELIQAGGQPLVTALTTICNKIWDTGEWPTQWTQSLVITLPKKGNLQLCSNYRTISLISHPSKIMLKVILNRLKPQAEKIIAEEQAGFRPGRSTVEQVCNLRILCEKYLQHQQDLYHVFIDFKKAFDRVWHAALWATMNVYSINANLIRVIQNLYARASSAVYLNGSIGEWFRTTVGVRQGCLLSPTLFNIFLERIMTDALENHEGTVSIGGRVITNLRFADDIDGLAGSEKELKSLVERLDNASRAYGMEISAEKTKTMTNNPDGIDTTIKVGDHALETVPNFKYLGAIVSDEGSKPEILARIAQATAALTKLKTIWKDKSVSTASKINLMRSLVASIFLYASESWTLSPDLERRIQAMEMRCFRRLLRISYKDHITNEEVKARIRHEIGQYKELLNTVKERKLRWFGHVTRGNSLAKVIMQGTVRGGRKRGRQKRRWEDNIREWTGLSMGQAIRQAEDREGWRLMIARTCGAPTVQTTKG